MRNNLVYFHAELQGINSILDRFAYLFSPSPVLTIMSILSIKKWFCFFIQISPFFSG